MCASIHSFYSIPLFCLFVSLSSSKKNFFFHFVVFRFSQTKHKTNNRDLKNHMLHDL